MKSSAKSLAAILMPSFAMICGCHSYQIDATVENRTGSAIELLEVDYPSASFGADSLAAGADFHYRFKVRGSGPVKVEYTDPASHQVRQVTGLEVVEHEEGALQIVLLPDGKAEFLPKLTRRP